ncbi:hypothetical protein HMPREF1015_01693 [Bacillus smithii 7_3_47FAA]|uniref:HpaB/PvcC/4-BUDH N-terminal domain-containing protein n=1 Tax=Bacillus smithii 7_3_47FAA TaxID=665952 RepID=G9QKK4_9BACI|nr:hypothetical protein HMPREF1015_01693 [Bacillus smithii 7_3_47FAA]
MMNGKEYMESLRDNRVVYLNGEKIDDVTEHPAYQNSARSFARMYDALHDEKQQPILTTVTEEGIRTHKFFKEPKDADDLIGARDAIAEWSKLIMDLWAEHRTIKPLLLPIYERLPTTMKDLKIAPATGTKKP